MRGRSKGKNRTCPARILLAILLGNQYMMVPERLVQHIVAQGLFSYFFVTVGPAADDDLRAAEVVAIGVVDNVHPFVDAVLEVGTELEKASGA